MTKEESDESIKRELRIVLVEDSIIDAEMTRHILKHNNLLGKLEVANRSLAARDMLKKMHDEGEMPHLILLDLKLPDISGIDLLREIKSDNALSKIPVVILTGSNEDLDIQKSYDLGAVSYIVKPISNDAMIQVIKKLFI